MDWAALSWSPRETWRAHRDGRFGLGQWRLCQPWRAGPAAPGGRVLLSVNEYRPHALRDVPSVARSAHELMAQVQALPDAVGVVGAYDPWRRITYSLSVWRTEDALRAFTVAPAHGEIMREYRSRGYLRHIHWWGTHVSVGASLAEATRRLDSGEGRRVGDARDAWARADRIRTAASGVRPDAPIWRTARPSGTSDTVD